MTELLTTLWPPSGDRIKREDFRHPNPIMSELLPFTGCICQRMTRAVKGCSRGGSGARELYPGLLLCGSETATET